LIHDESARPVIVKELAQEGFEVDFCTHCASNVSLHERLLMLAVAYRISSRMRFEYENESATRGKYVISVDPAVPEP